MGHSAFRLKQFVIHQDRCAMKVGTDGVLLGAWSGQGEHFEHILDVGTGTGLIALMMAQRFPKAKVTGIELDTEAALQARENVNNSAFADRVEIIHSDFFNWTPSQRFDLIVSNPPFYEFAHPTNDPERDMARHGNSFNLSRFLAKCPEMLASSGILAMILPYQVHQNLEFSRNGWHHKRICEVFPAPTKATHRTIFELRQKYSATIHEKITIEKNGRHQYSPEYISLTKDFYLKM